MLSPLLRKNLKFIASWTQEVCLGIVCRLLYSSISSVFFFYCPSVDVEQGNVDKKAMLMYLSSLYEALRNIEPAVVQTETREEIVRTTTSAEVEVCNN